MAWVGLVGFSSHAFESALAASPYPSLLAGVSAVDAIIGTAKYGNRLEDIWRKGGLTGARCRSLGTTISANV